MPHNEKKPPIDRKYDATVPNLCNKNCVAFAAWSNVRAILSGRSVNFAHSHKRHSKPTHAVNEKQLGILTPQESYWRATVLLQVTCKEGDNILAGETCTPRSQQVALTEPKATVPPGLFLAQRKLNCCCESKIHFACNNPWKSARTFGLEVEQERGWG
eukprot:4571617-Amphidinium_carterae.1